MGAAYPEPTAAQMLHRADRLLDAEGVSRMRSANTSRSPRSAAGLERDQARVRIGAADYLAGKTAAACAVPAGAASCPIRRPPRSASTTSSSARAARNDDEEMASVDAATGRALPRIAVAAEGARSRRPIATCW